MNSSTRRLIAPSLVCLLALGLAAPAPAYAEPLPPELDLVPRDAALVVSIRAADVWNSPLVKPLRDFIIEDPAKLRDIEAPLGFRVEELERLTIFIPGIDMRRGPSEPVVVLTSAKPYNLAKVLDAWKCMTPAEYQKMENERRKPVQPKNGPGPNFTPAPLKEGIRKSELPRKGDFFFINQQDDRVPGAKGKDAPRDLKAKYYVLGREAGILVPINDRTFALVFASERSAAPELLAALVARSKDGPLTPALEAAAGKHAAVLGLNLPLINNALPKEQEPWLQVLPFHSILSSRSAVFTLDLGEEITLTAEVNSADADTAKRAHDVLKAIHVLIVETLPGLKRLCEQRNDEIHTIGKLALGIVEPMLRNAQIEQKGLSTRLTMKAKIDAEIARSITTGIEQARLAAIRINSVNNLKQMGLAAHNFHDTNGMLPFPGVAAQRGLGWKVTPNPKLSWRVAILPFIEQQNLYTEFHFDEPWDSEHNKKLIAKMPKIYAPPLGVEAPAGHTFYRAFTGPNTISATPLTLQGIPDGTSNTIMVVEAGEAVPWTKPDEFPNDPNKPLPKLGGHFKGKMNVLIGDGSVRTLDLSKIDEKMIRAAITINGGEIIDWGR